MDNVLGMDAPHVVIAYTNIDVYKVSTLIFGAISYLCSVTCVSKNNGNIGKKKDSI